MKVIRSATDMQDYTGPCFIVPILADPTKHPHVNSISAVFIIPISGRANMGVIAVDHPDIPYTVTPDELGALLAHCGPGSITNKLHDLMFHVGSYSSNDFSFYWLDTRLYMEDAPPQDVIHDFKRTSEYNPIKSVYSRRKNVENINNAIGLYTWAEFALAYYNQYKGLLLSDPKPEYFYGNIDEYVQIESAGLCVDPELTKRHYGIKIDPENPYLWSYYNPFTAAGRPSNAYGKVNFAAINKSDGSRDCFITRFGDKGSLILFDYDSYHLQLISDALQIPPVTHDTLAKEYFNTNILSSDQRSQAKEMTFSYLYGTGDKIPDNDFFRRVRVLQTSLFSEVHNNKGILYLDQWKSIDTKNQFHPGKIFNYWLQNRETVESMTTIKRILKVLNKSGRKSKLVLYTYDSFLIDFNEDDGIDTFHELEQAVGKKFTYHQYFGKSYGNMKKV